MQGVLRQAAAVTLIVTSIAGCATTADNTTTGSVTSATPTAATTTASDPTATTVPATAAPTSAAPTTTLYPPDPGRLLDADDARLPTGYLTDRGHDYQDKPRKVRIRTDLAAYAHAARNLDPGFADRLGYRLQFIPWAVCVLGPTLPGGWNGYASEAAGYVEAARVAALNVTQMTEIGGKVASPFPVVWDPPATITNSPSLVALYELATTMFCPTDGSPRAGNPADHLPGWTPEGDTDVDTMDQLIPWWALDWQLGGGTVEVNGTSAAGAVYAAIAAVPDLDGYTAGDVHLFLPSECFMNLGYYASLLTPTPPAFWTDMDYLGGNRLVDETDVRSIVAITLSAQAIVEVGCPAVLGDN